MQSSLREADGPARLVVRMLTWKVLRDSLSRDHTMEFLH